MIPRWFTKFRIAAALTLASACLIATSGCDPRTMLYFLQPFEPTIAAHGPKLENKKVVILCYATSGALGEFPSIERDITREVASRLRAKVKKITIVDPDKTATWMEAHPRNTDPAEVANDFDADIVILLEIEQFRTQAPGDLNVVHGDSKTHIKVFEMQYPKNSKDKPIKDQPKEAKDIYDEYAESNFPNRGPLPIDTGSSLGAFKNKLTKIVATEITWHFVGHSEEDVIQDSRIER